MSARLNHGSWLARTIGAAGLNGTIFLELQSVVENRCSVQRIVKLPVSFDVIGDIAIDNRGTTSTKRLGWLS
jgi:hypothetical protein